MKSIIEELERQQENDAEDRAEEYRLAHIIASFFVGTTAPVVSGGGGGSSPTYYFLGF